jgi:hypothetical protein
MPRPAIAAVEAEPQSAAPLRPPDVSQAPNPAPETPSSVPEPPSVSALPRAAAEAAPRLVEAPRPRRTVDVRIGSVELRVQQAKPPEPASAPVAPAERPATRGLEEYAARRSYRGEEL